MKRVTILLPFLLVLSCTTTVPVKQENIFIAEGKRYFSNGDYRKASAAFHSALVDNPENADAYLWLGKLKLAKSDTFRAEIFLRKAISINKKLPEGYALLGDIYLARSDTQRAYFFFDHCPKDNRFYPKLHLRLAEDALFKGDEVRAREEFEKVLSAVPEAAEGKCALGAIAYLSGNYDEAEDALRCSYIRGKIPLAYLLLANSLEKRENLEEAYYILTRLVRNFPEYAEKHNLSGRLPAIKEKITTQIAEDEPKVDFSLERGTNLTVGIYSETGDPVKLLFEGFITRGKYSLTWDGTVDSGVQAPPGIYIGAVDSELLIKTKIFRKK
ncbi:tetratricopeptide repeat protein [bacterium]|nr:tetratricopeptide repeat protein [bacterium]